MDKTTTELKPGPIGLVEAIYQDRKRIGSIVRWHTSWLAYTMRKNEAPKEFPVPEATGKDIALVNQKIRGAAIEWLLTQT